MAAKANRAKSKARGKSAVAEKAVVRPKKKLKVAIAGFGTVGRSVAKVLCQDAGEAFELTHIFNRNVARKKVDWVPAGVRWTEN
ncbi:MAG TPA: homoserine dehydrogenase, partial [Verrucomicrobiae bacterium]|nr:homoserine dehydrogenase [Verrucomicrobiae bacterium]